MSPLTRRCLLAAALVALVTSSASVLPASAHPFGPPLTASIAGDGPTVTIRWNGAEDDWVTLGRFVGVFDEPLPDPTDDQARMPDVVGDGVTGLERMQASSRLRSYLLERIVVEQMGRPCPGEVVDVEDLLGAGIGLRFTCPEDVEVVDVELGVLTDAHEAYRTVASGADGVSPRQALYTATSTAHRWDLSGGGTSAGPAISPAVAGVVVALVIGAALAFLRPARGSSGAVSDRSRPTAHEPAVHAGGPGRSD